MQKVILFLLLTFISEGVQGSKSDSSTCFRNPFSFEVTAKPWSKSTSDSSIAFLSPLWIDDPAEPYGSPPS